ncbi:hypothetical protein DERP_014060, partial [Dermatophagoides pteronyssinus]
MSVRGIKKERKLRALNNVVDLTIVRSRSIINNTSFIVTRLYLLLVLPFNELNILPPPPTPPPLSPSFPDNKL